MKTSHITKTFDGIIALDDVNLAFREGEVTALVGPNGAGKTTLFNIITGFMRPDTGRVSYKSEDITNKQPHLITNLGVSRTFQVLRLFEGLTVRENLLLSYNDQPGEKLLPLYLTPVPVSRREGEISERADELLGFVGLHDKRDEYASDLSYGQQKLLSLAMCLATGADMLLLDEPVAGVDPQMFDKILALLEDLVDDERKTVCFIEHHMGAVAGISDRVVLLDEGRVQKTGTYEEVVESDEYLSAYGVRV